MIQNTQLPVWFVTMSVKMFLSVGTTAMTTDVEMEALVVVSVVLENGDSVAVV